MGVDHEEVVSLLKREEMRQFDDDDTKNMDDGKVNEKDNPHDSTEVIVKEVEVKNVEKSKGSTETKVQEDEIKVVSETDCKLCQASGKAARTFEKKSDYLKHLSLIHFGKQILQTFPFMEGGNCMFCKEQGKNYVAPKKELHVCHVGILHQKLFELLPPEIEKQIQEMPVAKRTETDKAGLKSKSSSKTPLLGLGNGAMIPCKYCEKSVLRRELKEHLMAHKEIMARKKKLESEEASPENVVNLKMK